MYKLHIGQSGESNALYISEKMGISDEVIKKAKKYIDSKEYNYEILKDSKRSKIDQDQQVNNVYSEYKKGDRVIVLGKNTIGIVYKEVDRFNKVIVLVKDEFIEINCKRISIESKAVDLYPEGYDLNQIFITYKDRKLEHDIQRGSKKVMKKMQKEMKERKTNN